GGDATAEHGRPHGLGAGVGPFPSLQRLRKDVLQLVALFFLYLLGRELQFRGCLRVLSLLVEIDRVVDLVDQVVGEGGRSGAESQGCNKQGRRQSRCKLHGNLLDIYDGTAWDKESTIPED